MERNILLIDDDLDEFLLITAVKEFFPKVIFHYANSAKNGFRLMEDLVPDIIMLDVNMPAVNGLECLKGIKKCPRLSKALVIMYSTYISEDVRQTALQTGATGCIKKPESISAIRQIIENILNDNDYKPCA